MNLNKPMSKVAQSQIIQELINSLQGVTDEKTIKKLTINAWQQLKKIVTNENTFRNTRTELRKNIKTAFPSSKKAKPGYYFTTEGKGKIERYEHLALWYATVNESRWNVIGDVARKEYFSTLQELPNTQPSPQPQPELQPELQPERKTLKLENMTLQQLELDAETQNIVQSALNHSGMSLADFIKQACTVYAKTVVGKAKQGDRDLTLIPTKELLTNNTYRTLPGRAKELTTRAIQAIMQHNDMKSEKSQKWCITAGAINALTGSKMGLIKNVMEGCKLAIDDHNIKHGLNAYDNRGRTTAIEQDIDFVNFSQTATPDVIALLIPEEPATPEALKVPEVTTPVVKEPKLKVQTMDAKTTTTQEIMDFLSQNPNTKVRLKEGRKAIHYIRAEDENGVMYGIKSEETGEITELKN